MRIVWRIKYLLERLLQSVLSPSAVYNVKMGKKVKIGKSCQVVNTTIGKYTYINSRCAVVNAEIGGFCSIAAGTVIGGGSHPTSWVSTSPIFHSGSNAFNYHFSELPYEPYEKTVIGNDVWIGMNSLIKAGVKIGDGAVIGMGSVVTHDVPPYCIVVGNPAHLIRKRFDDQTIESLQKINWFDFEDSELEKYAKYFNKPDEFIENVMTNED